MAWAHAAPGDRLAALTHAINLHPREAELYLERGDLHRAGGDFSRARADYLRARRLQPALPVVDLKLGILALERARPSRALRFLDRYLQDRPGDAGGWRWHARALTKLGRAQDAAEDFRRATAATSPSDRVRPEDFLEWAKALEAAGQRPEAIDVLDEGMRRLGAIVSLQLPAISLALDLGRVEEAVRRLETLQAGPGRPEVWLAQRGKILERAGLPDEARRAYAAALDILEAHSETRASRAEDDLEASIRAGLRRTAPAEPAVETAP
ncbi:MAG TPA: tetratricopeptide repeat protein [Candidatus Polarisedimenticolia bacterium]|nr:tetratricopeptide repeat protein [Candidatus Polarisedimenticolia bacterium]